MTTFILLKIANRLRVEGPSGLLFRSPEKLYDNSYGYCFDAANFAIRNLNRINLKYSTRCVFIENVSGRPNHWVTAFDYNNKLYIMVLAINGML